MSKTRQVGGTHYKGLAIQPFHFAQANEWDAGSFSILKYITRHRTKHGLEDLMKSLHFVEMRLDDLPQREIKSERIFMEAYCRANQMNEHDAKACRLLEKWVIAGGKASDTVGALRMVISKIGEYTYPEESIPS